MIYQTHHLKSIPHHSPHRMKRNLNKFSLNEVPINFYRIFICRMKSAELDESEEPEEFELYDVKYEDDDEDEEQAEEKQE